MFNIIVEAVMGFITNPIFVKYGLIGLFLNGIVSSITPFPTEVTTTALILSGADQFIIFSTLSIASITGGYLGYYIGYGGNSLLRRLFYYKNPENTRKKKGRELFKKHSWVAILLSSWMPVIGDIIPMAAGAKHYDLRKFTVAISVGKVSKSAAIVYLSGLILPHFFPI
jgi:membrane protein YqaA with SNARE-associated domain